MPYFRNFIYWKDKRRWKYYFLLATLAMGRQRILSQAIPGDAICIADEVIATQN
ncbi:hypothetical protein LL912_06225 [Niabella sp. CC-SYL272]|uniref:hypothetical protein n=1 Tax=Niabella agricola TaxID=2891571 RepID=UPI001F1B91A2|nr:hypothetical protein [Niabella agricola]MCF3108366.1 hypothetical protein [Niabella agricola]